MCIVISASYQSVDQLAIEKICMGIRLAQNGVCAACITALCHAWIHGICMQSHTCNSQQCIDMDEIITLHACTKKG